MSSVRRERDENLQLKAAASIAEMMNLCTSRKPSPNDKLLKNVTAMVCGDETETLKAGSTEEQEEPEDAAAKKKKSLLPVSSKKRQLAMRPSRESVVKR